jgi:hypothetical protein
MAHLFNDMIKTGADAGVSRMALEASRQTDINEFFAEAIDAGDEHIYTNASSTAVRLVYTACHATMRQSVGRTICSYGGSHKSRVHAL